MPTVPQTQALNDTISLLRSAGHTLLLASQQTNDVAALQQISAQHERVEGCVTQALQALASRDDGALQAATAALQQQVRLLGVDQAQLAALIGDVGQAAQIVSNLQQVARLILTV